MIIYTSRTCAECPKVKYFLNKWGVKYEERDIHVPEYAEEASKLAIQVPIVVNGDDFVAGSYIDKIRQLVNVAETAS